MRRSVVRIVQMAVLDVETAVAKEPRRHAHAANEKLGDRSDLRIVVAREKDELAAAIDVVRERGLRLRMSREPCLQIARLSCFGRKPRLPISRTISSRPNTRGRKISNGTFMSLATP